MTALQPLEVLDDLGRQIRHGICANPTLEVDLKLGCWGKKEDSVVLLVTIAFAQNLSV